MIARNLTLDHLSNRGNLLLSVVTVSCVPIADDDYLEDLTFEVTSRKVKAAVQIAASIFLNWGVQCSESGCSELGSARSRTVIGNRVGTAAWWHSCPSRYPPHGQRLQVELDPIGSPATLGGPTGVAAPPSRSSRRRIFPMFLFGSGSLRNSITRGNLYPVKWRLQCESTSASVSVGAFGTITTLTTSLERSSRTPIPPPPAHPGASSRRPRSSWETP